MEKYYEYRSTWKQDRSIQGSGWIGGTILLLLFSMMAGTGEAWAEQKIGVEELNNNFDKFIGKTVTVRGEVENVYDEGTFTIDEEGIVGKDLLVFSSKPASGSGGSGKSAMLKEDDIVQVTGMVRRFVVTEIERELGFDLDPEIEVEVEQNRPVIIAKSITPEP